MKNTKKIAINKHFFASALLITLIFLAFGINVDDSYALDLNESCDDEEMGLDIEDKLENSQNEVMEVESQSDEVLRAGPYVLDGGTFGALIAPTPFVTWFLSKVQLSITTLSDLMSTAPP